MPSHLLKSLAIFLTVLSLCITLTACHDEDDAEEEVVDEKEIELIGDLDFEVGESGYPILEKENSLHIFTKEEFFEDKTDEGEYDNIFEDKMELSIYSFTEADTTEEPDIDDDDVQLSDNDLGYTQLTWNEKTNEEKTALRASLEWKLKDPLLDSKFVTREYLIVSDGEVSDIFSSNYQPLYEAVDEDIIERRQSAIFVWDFDDVLFSGDTLDTEKNVSGEDLKDWERLSIYQGYDILYNASIWAEDNDDEFSEGATIYGATRSIIKDIVVIEAVQNEGSYSLNATEIYSGTDSIDIEEWLGQQYPVGESITHLDYLFTVDFFSHHFVNIQFDTENDEAHLFTTNTTESDQKIIVGYTIDADKKTIELNTTSLDKETLDGLNLPAYFNPVIAGPFNEDSNDYYYGKHYLLTDATQRLKLEPVFFLNDTAKNDVQTIFEQWRLDRHEEE